MATIHETDDTTALDELFPLHDLSALTDEQTDTLARLTAEAMRPLVEAAWERRGYDDVRWDGPRLFGRLCDEETEDADALASVQIGVWSEAYDALDADELIATATTV